MIKEIISFGVKHGLPQGNDIGVIDVRQYFTSNPYHDKKLRYLRGIDGKVQADIRKTPNFHKRLNDVLIAIVPLLHKEVLYIGCTGGHHRSVYIAILLGEILHLPVAHRDINKK